MKDKRDTKLARSSRKRSGIKRPAPVYVETARGPLFRDYDREPAAPVVPLPIIETDPELDWFAIRGSLVA